MQAEDLYTDPTPEEKRADRLVAIAQKQIQTSVRYKEQRMADIQKSIDLYEGKTKKALKGRWNVPLPVMSGYVDTLLSKTDDAPKLKYGYTDIADMEAAAKTQAKWEEDAGEVEQQWALKDRMEKKLASFSGVGLSKVYAYNDPEYRSCYEVVDYQDFEVEPLAGQLLKDAKYHGQRNIFKSKSDLMNYAGKKIYSRRQVLKLIMATGPNDTRTFQKLYTEKTERLRALGFNVDQGSYTGVPMFNVAEWIMEDPENGEKYYLLFEPHTGIWVRACPLKEIFASDESPFTAWHTHPDAFNFWSKAPADDMRPIADAIHIIFNQSLDARDRQIYRQRAFDPAVFEDPTQLEWRADGLVQTVSGISASQPIGNGIFELSIPDVNGQSTINLVEFLDSLAGTKTGVTAAAQGAADNEKVGIYFGNLQQVADRLGLYNKSYSEAWGRKGLRYWWGLREHATDGMMVRMLGARGYNWVELTKKDRNPERQLSITIVGGSAEAAQDEVLKKTKSDSLNALITNPNFAPRLNPEVTIENVMRNGGWEEADIKRFLDKQPAGSEFLISRAHQAIQEILEGGTPKPVRGATTLFMQTIVDFADEAFDLDLPTYQRLMEYAMAHRDIALQNMSRDLRLALAAAGTEAPPAPGAPGAGPAVPPAPGMPTVPGSPAMDVVGAGGAPVTPAGAAAVGVPSGPAVPPPGA